MFLILDTNIFIEDWHFTSPPYKALLDFAKKTNSTFLMPRVVLEELKGKFAQHLEGRQADYNQAERQLNRLLNRSKELWPAIDVARETERYMAATLRRLRIKKANVLAYPEGTLDVLVKKAVSRTKPFTPKGEEFRDALLWEVVLAARLKIDTPEHMVFLSNDAGAFGNTTHKGKEGELHPQLLEEAERRLTKKVTLRDDGEKVIIEHCNTLEYFRKVSDFIGKYHGGVASFSKSWLKKHLPLPEVKKLLRELLLTDDYFQYRMSSVLSRRSRGEFAGIDVDGFQANLCGYSLYTNSDASSVVFFELDGQVDIIHSVRKKPRYRMASYMDHIQQDIEAEHEEVAFLTVNIQVDGTLDLTEAGEATGFMLYRADLIGIGLGPESR